MDAVKVIQLPPRGCGDVRPRVLGLRPPRAGCPPSAGEAGAGARRRRGGDLRAGGDVLSGGDDERCSVTNAVRDVRRG